MSGLGASDHRFRVNAGLPSATQPLGGWEAPDVELRGHFTGHYLSACALQYAATGDPEVRDRAQFVIQELARAQRALGGGYLSAFPLEYWDRLAAGTHVWAPFYTVHKIMAGMCMPAAARRCRCSWIWQAGWTAGQAPSPNRRCRRSSSPNSAA